MQGRWYTKHSMEHSITKGILLIDSKELRIITRDPLGFHNTNKSHNQELSNLQTVTTAFGFYTPASRTLSEWTSLTSALSDTPLVIEPFTRQRSSSVHSLFKTPGNSTLKIV